MRPVFGASLPHHVRLVAAPRVDLSCILMPGSFKHTQYATLLTCKRGMVWSTRLQITIQVHAARHF